MRGHLDILRLPLALLLVATYGCTLGELPGADRYLKLAAKQERRGDIGAAIESLLVAQTLDPSAPAVRAQLARLYPLRDAEAKKHYRSGHVLKQSDVAAARREFMAALRLKPDHPGALKELRQLAAGEVREVKELPDGEPLDESTNSLSRATALYEQGDYAAALHVLQGLKDRQSDRGEVKQRIRQCHYQLGIAAFRRLDFQQSRELFLKAGKDFESSGNYLERIDVELKKLAESHYKQGLQWYRQQRLDDAITAWRKTLAIVPDHQKARDYIEKAHRLLEALKNQ